MTKRKQIIVCVEPFRDQHSLELWRQHSLELWRLIFKEKVTAANYAGVIFESR